MEKVRIQDDLYHYVNGEWLEKAVIPDDRPATGGFINLIQDVEKTMMFEFASMSKNKSYPNSHLENAIRLYDKVLNEKKRNKDGIKPVLKTLKKIEKLKNISDLNRKLSVFIQEQISLPFVLSVDTDMKDTSKHCLVFDVPNIILPDTTFYANKENHDALIGIFSSMASEVLKYTKLSEEEQNQYLKDALAFDELLAKYVKSNEEKAEYVKSYNPMKLSQVNRLLKPLKIKKLVKDIFHQEPEYVVITEPRYFKAFKEIFNEETFVLFQHWCYVKELLGACPYLNEKLRELGGIYSRALNGVKTMRSIDKYAYQLASTLFSEPVGIYYGEKYFGRKAKEDIVKIVYEIIDTYKHRIADSDILLEETKKKAILKLTTMKVKMGYPDKADEVYDHYLVDEKDSLYESVKKISQIRYLNDLNQLFVKTNRDQWVMAGHVVNACYNPSCNDITFPAAILQAPFYSIHQTRSQNLGGIGAVIGHEISHAFDNNGALFDENGNLCHWWKKQDFAKFKAKTKAMIQQFDGIELPYGKVNGTLIVSENIADNGGVAVTLDIMSHMENPNYEEYFINWAKIWCLKAREAYLKTILAIDVHAPSVLRANMPIRNFDAWYQTYHVTAKDKMYIKKNKRIVIW